MNALDARHMHAAAITGGFCQFSTFPAAFRNIIEIWTQLRSPKPQALANRLASSIGCGLSGGSPS
jgi:hypothetical protein